MRRGLAMGGQMGLRLSPAGRELAGWAAVTGAWVYANSLAVFGWAAGLLAAAVVAGGLAAMARFAFRRMLSGQWRERGAAAWLMRQPRWRLAVMYGAPFAVMPVAILVVMGARYHIYPPPLQVADGLCGSVITAAGFGAFHSLVVRRQAERAQAGGDRGR